MYILIQALEELIYIAKNGENYNQIVLQACCPI